MSKTNKNTIKEPFKQTFQKTVESYLLSIAFDNETILRTDSFSYSETNCILYVENGLKRLNIGTNTYIGVEYFDNPVEFEQEKVVQKYSNKYRVVVFLNLERKSYYTDKYSNRVRFIYIDDLDSSNRIKPNERIVESALKKSKCINIDYLYEYAKFIFRVKLLQTFFSGEVTTSYVFGNKNDNKTYGDVFPFRYIRRDINYIFFENKDSIKTNFPEYLNIDNRGEVVFEQVSINQKESAKGEFCFLTITEKENISFDEINRDFIERTHIRVPKVINNDLVSLIGLFNQGGEYEIDDFFKIFKYRPFPKTRFDKEETIAYNSPSTLYKESYEICIGSRNAIEKNEIWFSTYEYLNDPFDLVIRAPTVLESTKTPLDIELNATEYNVSTNNGLAIFCATTENDNILMWAHYADSGKGMCTMYYQNELLASIANDSSIGLCLYGRIKYSIKRPSFFITVSALRF